MHQKRTLKHGKRIVFAREKGGLAGALLGGQDVVYLYHPADEPNTSNIREFLKDYCRYYEKEGFDTNDQGVFLCTGTLDKGLFRDLKNALVRDEDIASTISVKALSSTPSKRKRVIEEERIREKITEREITRRRVTEERVSVKGLVNRIKRFEPHIRAKREKQLENMLVANLQAFYTVRTQLTYERARIDAQVGNIGIEVKLQPSAGDLDRLYGQIEKYLNHLESIIAVIGNEKSKETTNYFKERLKKRGWLNKRVFVITK